MKKFLLALAAIALIGGIIFASARNGQNGASSSNSTSHSESQSSTTSTTVSENKVSVSISNFQFPNTIKISKGGTVTWTNQDTAMHDVKSDDDSPAKGLASPLLAKGESFSFNFDTPGVYKYHCTPHPNMTGTVEVTE
jgi:plastocyanin